MKQLFNYQGKGITFRDENQTVYVNATQMARPFGKRPSKWLELPSTDEFLSLLQQMRSNILLVQTEKGRGGATWLQEDVALEFARWLSPAFAIWCNDRIKELLKYGFTATQNKLDQLTQNPELIIELSIQLKEERAKKEQLEQLLTMKSNLFSQEKISAKAVALYSLLLEQKKQMNSDVFFLSDVSASQKLKLNRRTIQNARKELSEAKLLTFYSDLGLPITYHLKNKDNEY